MKRKIAVICLAGLFIAGNAQSLPLFDFIPAHAVTGISIAPGGNELKTMSTKSFVELVALTDSIPPDTIPPAAPTGLIALAVDGTVVLNWIANNENDLSAYSIYRGENNSQPVSLGIIVPGAITMFTDTTIAPGLRTYTYQLTALDASGNESQRSVPVTLFTLDTTPPVMPANFTAQSGNGQVVLTWAANAERDLSFYSIRRTVNGSQLVFLQAGRSSTSFTDTSVAIGTTYAYQISAIDFSRNESPRSAATILVTDTIPPAAPTGLAAQAVDGTIVLNWNANNENDLTAYALYRGENNSQPAPLGIILPGSVTTFTDTTIAPGLRQYNYQLTALDASGNESQRSAPVSLFTLDEIPPAMPANFTAQAGDGQVVLTWAANNTERDLSFYSIRRTVNGSQLVFLNGGRSHTLTDTNVTNGVTYTYQISARDFSRNESARSALVPATPQAQQGISLFPNPSSGPVSIQLPDSAHATVTVRDQSNGVVIYQGSYQRSSIDLDLGGAAKGLYVIDIQQGTQTRTVRVQIK